MREFTHWLQREIYRLAGGGTITLPPGPYLLTSPIKVSQGMDGISIVGTNTRLIAHPSVGLGPMLYADSASDISVTGVSFDARDCDATRAVLFASCTGVTLEGCTFLGGITCVELRTTTAIVVNDIVVGGCSDVGAGNGRGLYITLSSNDIAVDGVRAYDANLRHLVSCEDNVEDASLLDLATETAHTFACLDLHGKLEGNAVAGSITANGCAGRVNCGNPDHTNGSHLTLLNHNGQGKLIIVDVNSNLRYQDVTNGTIDDQSGGTATITNLAV